MSDFHLHQALFSVSDKSQLYDLASSLPANTTLLASGGTAQYLRSNNLLVTDIADYTEVTELLGGRVKTLHPRIHGGILGRRHLDAQEMQEHHLAPIDLVVVNFYPFVKTIQTAGDFSKIIENIDIGGSTLLRAAAKNFADVLILCDPEDYPETIERIQSHTIDLTFRQNMATKAFAYSAHYEAAIANYFSSISCEKSNLPKHFFIGVTARHTLRYGENPQQKAGFYQDSNTSDNSLWQTLQGKELSYNNYLDSDVALRLVQALKPKSAVIIKHASPCGVSSADDLLTAGQRAFAADPVSAFGGIAAVNVQIEEAVAHWFVNNGFWEVMIAPSFSEPALEIFKKKKNLRLLLSPKTIPHVVELRNIFGGFLIQETDTLNEINRWQTVSQAPAPEELFNDLVFAWQVCRFAKSNAIVYARNQQTLGIGNGQTSRIDSAFCAARKAQESGFDLTDAVMASDAFFPFADSVEMAAKLGIRAIIQPGGSIRDSEVIDAANHYGIALIFTGRRHFRH